MRKYLFFTVFLLFAAVVSKATVYYSDPVGGNFNAGIWSASATGPFTVLGTAITSTDDIIVQGGTVTLNLSSGTTYCTNMTVKSGATVTTIQQASFAGDVTIESGGIILLGPLGGNTGGIFVQNLFINTGGKLWGNDPVNTGALNVKTIRINGSQLVCNGTIGDGANNDGLLIQPEGATITISGSGNIDVSRIRKGAATNTVTNLIIDANVNARFGTTCIYNNQNSSTFNITVNQNKTLKCIGIANPTGFPGTEGSISLNGTTGGSTRRQALYTINGLLECDNMYLAATSTTAADVFKYLVTSTGTLKVNTQLKGNSATASTTATADLQLQAGATLKLLGAVPTSSIDQTGTKNIFAFDAASIVEYAGAAQSIENKFGNYGNLIISGTDNKSLQANTTVVSNLTIQNGAILDVTTNNFNLNIGGNWVDNNTTDGFIENNATVNFNGSVAQTINSIATESFYDLNLNNSNGFSLSNNATISNSLSLIAGIVNVGAGKQLRVANTATTAISGGSSTSFINGKLVRAVLAGSSSYVFPIGKGTKYADIVVKNIGAATDIATEYFATAYSNIATVAPFKVSSLEYWNITGLSNSIAASITLNYYNGNTSGITTPAQLSLAFFNGTQWNNLGQTANTGNAASGSVTGAATALGIFTFGTTSSLNPLPVNITGFSIKPLTASSVKLSWITWNELNLKNFIVERSIDGTNFYAIGSVLPTNIQQGNAYQFIDYAALKGISYYRIKCLDVDGQFKFSNIASYGTNASTSIAFQQINGAARLIFPTTTSYSINVLNTQGQCLLKQAGNSSLVNINLQNQPAGTYVLQVICNSNNASFIFIK